MNTIMKGASLAIILLLTACSGTQPQDYTNYKNHLPRSILVVTPKNHSLDIKANASFLTQINYPLAEAGYYVFPVAVVGETFQQNGLITEHDIRSVPPQKIREIFGADALLDITINDYGTQWQIIDSVTRVTAEATLIDLKTGLVLWSGKATASNNEQNSSTNYNLVSLLINAAAKQIQNTVNDCSHAIAGVTACRLLRVGGNNGLLPGPRSPAFAKEKP